MLPRGTTTRLTDFAAETIEDRKLWNIKMLKLKTARQELYIQQNLQNEGQGKTFSINKNRENFSQADLHSEKCESELVMLKGWL